MAREGKHNHLWPEKETINIYDQRQKQQTFMTRDKKKQTFMTRDKSYKHL